GKHVIGGIVPAYAFLDVAHRSSSRSPERPMDALGSVATSRDRCDRQVLARVGDAVPTRPDLGIRRAPFGVGLDPAVPHGYGSAAAVEVIADEGLADRLEHLVGGDGDRLAEPDELAVLHLRVFQLDASHLAGL